MVPSQASNLAFSAVALLASLLLIIQLPIHFEPTKSSNWLFLVWMILLLLKTSINAIIWNDNTVNWAPVWCNISSNLALASDFGVQLGLLCISRRLYQAVTSKIQKDHEERRRMLLDIFVAIGVPLLWLPLDYILESQQFIIVEQIGCYPAIRRTIPSIPLLTMWPVIFALVTAVYSGLTMVIMRRHRTQMREFNDYGDKVDYRWRLTLLSSAQIVLILPWRIYSIALDSMNPFSPYNWDDLHAGFSQVHQYPIDEWIYNTTSLVQFELSNRWLYILYAFLFVALFGWTKRARNYYNKYYGRFFFAAMKLVGYHVHSSPHDQEDRRDLQNGSFARGPVFRTFLTSLTTSLGVSRVTSTQTNATTYHTATEQIDSGPELPAPIYRSPTHEHDLMSPQLPFVETAIAYTQNSDNVSPTSSVSNV